MKASLNVPRTDEEGKDLEEYVEERMSRKSYIKLRTMHLQARIGAESSEEEPENHAMTRSLFQFQRFSFEFCPQARHETGEKAEEAGPAEEEP